MPRLGDQKAKPASLAVHIFGPFPARFSLKQKLFPPIPQVKQDLASSFMSNLEVSDTGWLLVPATTSEKPGFASLEVGPEGSLLAGGAPGKGGGGRRWGGLALQPPAPLKPLLPSLQPKSQNPQQSRGTPTM